MRYSRLVRLIMRIFLLLLASTMSLVSFLGGYSALLILGDEDNIDLNVNMTGDMFNINDTTFEIELKFEFDNKGYFDLEDLKIELEISMLYDYINYTVLGQNDTLTVKIFEEEKSFKTVENGEKLKGSISIEREDLELSDSQITDIVKNMDRTRSPMTEFVANKLEISGKYSLGLISFKVEIEDYELDVNI